MAVELGRTCERTVGRRVVYAHYFRRIPAGPLAPWRKATVIVRGRVSFPCGSRLSDCLSCARSAIRREYRLLIALAKPAFRVAVLASWMETCGIRREGSRRDKSASGRMHDDFVSVHARAPPYGSWQSGYPFGLARHAQRGLHAAHVEPSTFARRGGLRRLHYFCRCRRPGRRELTAPSR